ncbi:MAG: YggS family pyridoxal phosphate-dependent enzyme [Flavobacteriales bacterium]|nr:YggS family pyridoxal phosphate-dependent enzyme [Flavobacteriales bacterium]
MIAKNLSEVLTTVPNNVELIAVSKTKPNSDIESAYHAGQRHFGENKVQELVQKWETLPKDIHWHLIGNLQRNKVKYIAEFVHLIHAVDSLKLLVEINKQAEKHQRIINCLLQFHIAEESTKFGLSLSEAIKLIGDLDLGTFKNVKIVGVMGMATFTDDQHQIKKEFDQLNQIFKSLKTSLFQENPDFKEISMGMSGDYELAIQSGSTMVRVGSKIFGTRNYPI